MPSASGPKGHMKYADAARIVNAPFSTACYGRIGPVSTASKSPPCTWFNACSSPSSQFSFGAADEPVGAVVRDDHPIVFMACRMVRSRGENPLLSNEALRRTRRPIGGSAGSSLELAKCVAGWM